MVCLHLETILLLTTLPIPAVCLLDQRDYCGFLLYKNCSSVNNNTEKTVSFLLTAIRSVVTMWNHEIRADVTKAIFLIEMMIFSRSLSWIYLSFTFFKLRPKTRLQNITKVSTNTIETSVNSISPNKAGSCHQSPCQFHYQLPFQAIIFIINPRKILTLFFQASLSLTSAQRNEIWLAGMGRYASKTIMGCKLGANVFITLADEQGMWMHK